MISFILVVCFVFMIMILFIFSKPFILIVYILKYVF